MRIWDIPVGKLCRAHLLGEHRELHAIWSVITKNKKGYARHPETLRWHGRLKALYQRHEALVQEMKSRGYKHFSSISSKQALGSDKQDLFVHTIAQQKKILKNKKCGCRV
jgi:hypothetical protein